MEAVWVWSILLLYTLSPALSSVQQVYFKAEGDLVLRPQVTPDPVFAILWTFNNNVAVEWIMDKVPITTYEPFLDRTELNLSTGEVRVRGATGRHVGRFIAELNHDQQDLEFESRLISEVSKPTVVVKPLSCSFRSARCTLSCSVAPGDTGDTGPLSFSWSVDGQWKEGLKDLQVFNNGTKERSYMCRVRNPLSQQDSLPYDDVFKDPQEQASVGGVVGGVVGAVLLMVVVGGLLWYFRETKPVQSCLSAVGVARGTRAAEQPANGTAPSSDELQNLNTRPAEGV